MKMVSFGLLPPILSLWPSLCFIYPSLRNITTPLPNTSLYTRRSILELYQTFFSGFPVHIWLSISGSAFLSLFSWSCK
ncbi:hypothetical protein GQ53DRAFT_526639 [Thozetella sp. PMI_491]|nr:hypothetical protein GQ53DRAFT_526639 [Thozetella sp. PMI_491]